MRRSIFAASAVLATFAFLPPLPAQIATDGTLPGTAVEALNGPDYTISAGMGHTAGTNLFHSFSQFNVLRGQTATFTGPAGIENVLSRVTGGASSTVDGLLRSNIENADFYFMNPYGVVFGPHASLDVPASFYVTTADYLKLSDGSTFNSIPAAEDALLSVSSPEAFGFLDGQNGAVNFNGSGSLVLEVNAVNFGLHGNGITVAEGEQIFVAAGEIELTSGLFAGFFPVESRFRAAGGRISLVGARGAVEIPTRLGEAAGHQDGGAIAISGRSGFGDRSTLDVSANGGGEIYIRAGTVEIDGGIVRANNLGDSPHIGIGVSVRAVQQFTLRNGGSLEAEAFGSGRGGDLEVTAGLIEVRGFPAGFVTDARGGGDAGDIHLSSSLFVLDDGRISGQTRGSGAAAHPCSDNDVM